MDKKHIDAILEDLYTLDPTLRTHEAEVRRAVELLLQSQPDITVNKKFVSDLRARLMAEPGAIRPSFFSTFLFSMKRPYVALGGAALVALVAISAFQLTQFSGNSSTNSYARLFAVGDIKTLSESAFGNLGTGAGALAGRSAEMAMGGFGGGAGGDAAKNMVMPYPEVRYVYRYTGDALPVHTESTMPVYRRTVPAAAASTIGNIMKTAGGGLMDLNTFKSLKAQSVTLYEDGDKAYAVTIDFFDGRASINPHWPEWQLEQTGPLPSIKESDIPADDRLISIANAFLRARGIDTSKYAAPQVDKSWKQYQPMMERTGEEVYIPDVHTIVYPYKLDANTASNWAGQAEGMRVSVEVRNNRVQSVWNILAGSWERSIYAIETNGDRLKQLAEQGGAYGGGWYGSKDAKEVVIELGTPEIVYTDYRLNDDGKGGTELYIPAYRFPIKNKPAEAPYMGEYLLVPLPKQVLDSIEKQRAEQPPVMPFSDPAVTNGRG